MTTMSVEIEGGVDEVILVLQQLGSTVRHTTAGDAGLPMETLAGNGEETTPVSGARIVRVSSDAFPREWTEALASEFLARLDIVARRVALHVWRAGAAGIHRSALCQRAELMPSELHSLLVRMGHMLRRYQEERGMILPRPVVSNNPLQNYFVDPDFAAVAAPQMFGVRMPHQPANVGGLLMDEEISLLGNRLNGD